MINKFHTFSIKNTYIVLLILSLTLIFFAFYSIQPIQPFDEFFYIQTGKDYLINSLSPWVDHYSFTHFQQAIRSTPYLYEITFAWLTINFGLVKGYQLFLLAHFSLLITILYFYVKYIKVHWFVLLSIIPILVYFILLRSNPRPELLGHSLIILSILLYFKARKSFGIKELSLISLLLLLWTNWHTPIFGYMIFFALFIDKLFDKLTHKDSSFTLKYWFFWGILIFVIGFIHPNSGHFFIDQLIFIGQDWQSIVTEFTAVKESNIFTTTNNFLWIITILVTIFFLKQKSYGLVFIILLSIYFSFQMHRLLIQSAIIVFTLSLYMMSHQEIINLYLRLKPNIKYFILISGLIISTVSIYFIVSRTADYFRNEGENGFISNTYPSELVKYLNENRQGGNIFNEFGLGGYYIYSLSPNFKVFWDGRLTLLYPYEFAKKYIQAKQSNALLFINEEKNYDFDYLIIKATTLNYVILNQSKDMNLDYIDNNDYFLYVNTKKNKHLNFKLTSSLSLFPMCWNDQVNQQVLNEVKNSYEISLSDTSRISKVYKIMNRYQTTPLSELFSKKYLMSITNDHEKRLLAYIAFKLERYDTAIELFFSLSKKNNKDLIMALAGYDKTGQSQKFKILLSIFLSSQKTEILRLEPLKVFEQAMLLTQVMNFKKNNTLSIKLNKQVSKLSDDFSKINHHWKLPLDSLYPDDECQNIFK